MDRLVSLAPSATSAIQALGAGDRLVATTAHSDVEDAETLGGWLTPDLDRLTALEPDLVLTVDALQREVRDAVRARDYPVVHHEPATLEDVLDGFASIGHAIGRGAAGEELAGSARERVAAVKNATPDDPADRPVVYCEEWPEPPMAAGNWVPEAVEAAGGRYPFGLPGDRSRPVDRSTVADADPDHVIVHHCGFGEQASTRGADRWQLDAEVHVIDDALLNQPGPRLVDGIERLAELVHSVD